MNNNQSFYQYKLIFNIVLFLSIIVVFTCGKSVAEEKEIFSKNIKLSNNCELNINTTVKDSVLFELTCPGEEIIGIEVEWSGIREDNIQNIKLPGDVKALFITAWDLSSTYGAQTNIVVWENNKKWKMVEAPFIRGFAEDKNNDGIFELIDYYPKAVRYKFDNGEFIQVYK